MNQPSETPPPMSYYTPGPPPSGGGKAIASFVLGIISLLAWCVPILGLPISVIGLVLGIQDKVSRNRGLAIAGIVMSSLGLAGSVVNGAVGAYMGAMGRHSLVNKLGITQPAGGS